MAKNKLSQAGFGALICIVAVLCWTALPAADRPRLVAAPTKRILVVGDSWAAGMTFAPLGNPFQAALDRNGHDDIQAVATLRTTVPGSTAAQWASNAGGRLDHIKSVLEAVPTIDIVFITLGGNDLNAQAIQRNLADLTEPDRRVLWEKITGDIRTVIDALLAVRPSVRVVLCEYDYFNLAANATSPIKLNFHGVTQEQYNGLFAELGRHKMELARRSNGRVLYVHNLGLNQRALGDATEGYVPETVPAPGGPPDYQPYPGGNPAKPGPAAAFANPLVNDGFHLNAAGYARIVENALRQGMGRMLDEP